MKIHLSKHAKDQRKKRNIQMKYIKETIAKPDEIISSYRERKLLRKQYKDKLLEVVILQENDIIIVVTQYYLDI